MRVRSIGLGAAVVLTLMGGWGAFAWWACSEGSNDSPASLVAATEGRRFVEPRVVGMAWAPPERPRGPAAQAAADPDRWRLAALAARLDPNDDAHALGIASLLLGATEDAITQLETARENSPHHGQVLSDLAAALLVRGSAPERSQDLIRALDLTEQALASAPNLHEARFNKALAAERIGLREAALEAWEDYLGADPGSPWADEARSHADRLRTAPRATRWEDDASAFSTACASGDARTIEDLVRVHPQPATEAVMEAMGNAASDRAALAVATNGARALTKVLGDRMFEEAALEILREGVSRSRTERLAAAHSSLRRGRHALDELQANEANRLLTDAVSRLAALHSPYRDLAELYRLSSAFHLGRPEAVLHDLEVLIERAKQERRQVVEARALWLQGLVLGSTGRKFAAVTSFASARACFERLGFTADATFVRYMEASTLWGLGRHSRSWTIVRQVFEELDAVSDPRRAQALLGSAAFEADLEGYRLAALFLQEAALVFAGRHSTAVDRCDAVAWLARTAQLAGREEVAAAALRDGRLLLRQVRDPDVRERIALELSIVEARRHEREEPERAIAILDQALAAGARSERLLELRFLRARARERSGDLRGASDDYVSALEWMEQQRSTVADPYVRTSFFDTVAELGRSVVQFELEREDSQRALLLADRVRATSVTSPDAVPTARGPLERLRQGLLPDQAVVFFSVLEERTAAWVIRPRATTYVSLLVSEEELQRRVARWRRAAAGSRLEELDQEGAELFRSLLGPLRSLLQDSRTVVIVPDGCLHALSWGALRDPESGRRWVEDAAVAVAPSLRALVGAAEPSQDPSAYRIVVVANPAFDRASHPELADLLGAAREAQAIRTLFPGATLLEGTRATPTNFLQEAAHAQIVHVAAHAVPHATDPELSTIVLSPGGALAPDGGLTAGQIAGRDMRHLRLVVLAACRSGDGPLSRMDGPLSLARPFLGNGARAVAVSLWDFPDAAGDAIFVPFYRELRAGRPPTEALRRASLACWTAPRPDARACGGVQLILNGPMGG